jgi:CBS domain-containing membrane protein
MMNNKEIHISPPDMSEEDIIEAMKTLHGYVDITVGDFKQIYQIAYYMIRNRLLNSITAHDLMAREVLQLEETLPLVQAASMLAEKQVSGAPVVDSEQKIVGIVTEKDFLKEMGFGSNPSFMQIATHCLHDKSCMIGNLRARTVADIMSKQPFTIPPEVTVGDISTIFAERKINHLPIVDPNGLIVGIVTRTDLARAYHTLAEDR